MSNYDPYASYRRKDEICPMSNYDPYASYRKIENVL